MFILGVEELKSKLAAAFEPVEYEVERGAVKRFTEAVGDLNPRWDKVAPPTFVLVIGLEQLQQQLIDAFPSATILHGSTDLECYQPVKPGDVIEASTVVTNVRERQGKMGNMVFITIDTTYKNQRQELVAKSRQLVISY